MEGGTRAPARLETLTPRLPLAAVLLSSVLPFLGGCVSFWDDVTSHDFHVRDLWTKPNPMVVLRDSSDGDQRAKALRALKEPKQNGGGDQEQDAVVKILTTAAVTERQALCRLAAVQALAGFKDQRAAQGLVEAYYRADTYQPETATVIKCQVLTALGATGNPLAVDLLVRVVKEPPTEGSEDERKQAYEVRLAAARALSHFPQYQAVEALVQVLKTDRNVALRDRAHESLQLVTGKELPPDYQAWDDLLRQSGQPDAFAVTAGGSKLKLVGFFQSVFGN